jgi:hypothetical protein
MNHPAVLEDYGTLYRRAFAKYRTFALWEEPLLEHPTAHDALRVAQALRAAGDGEAQNLAEQIEQACRNVL